MSHLDAGRARSAGTFDPKAHEAALNRALAEGAPGSPLAWAGPALDALVAACAAERGSLLRLDPATGALAIVAGRGIPSELIGRPVWPRPRSIAYWVLHNRRGLVLQGRVDDPRFESTTPGETIESSMCVPVRADAHVFGVLNLARSTSTLPFSEADLARVTEMVLPWATRLAATIEAELGRDCVLQLHALEAGHFPARLSVGRSECRGWEVSLARCPGLRPGLDVADRLVLEDGLQALMLADVPGDGATAAARAGFLAGAFAGHVTAERSARGMLSRLSAELSSRGHGACVAALWAAFLTPRGDVRTAVAGFPPVLWVPVDDGPLTMLERGGPPLGCLSEPVYDEESFRALPGDLLIAATDGVLLARDTTGREFGLRGLGDLLEGRRRDPVDVLAEAILGAVAQHAGIPPADDRVVLVARYSPER